MSNVQCFIQGGMERRTSSFGFLFSDLIDDCFLSEFKKFKSKLTLKLVFDLMLQQINGHWFKTHKSMSCPLLTIYVPKHPPPIYNKKYQKM